MCYFIMCFFFLCIRLDFLYWIKCITIFFFFFSSRRRHTRYWRDWSSDVCSSDLLAVLTGAGLLTAAGQLLLTRLSSGNSIDVTTAIWFHAGRLPAWRTLGSAVLSVVVVGMGASLGREGAPKQAGAVIANAASDRARLTDDQRRLLVACGSGARLSAAYW